MYVTAQTNNIFGVFASFLLEDIFKVHGGFISIKYISKYIKVSKIGAISCQ